MTVSSAYRQGESRGVLPDELTLGEVHLRVSELDRSVDFYTGVIGLQVIDRDAGIARLGAGTDVPLLVLHEHHGAKREARRSGLYHVAILYPTQEELARVAQRIRDAQAPIEGASDHGTHEAIYLPDPDGNGLELAWDRAPELWPNYSDLEAIRPQPLDFGGLFNIVSGREPVPEADPETRIGHVHLHVGDVADSLRFYRDRIGFNLIAQIDTAAFVSAGGYHHHLAFNTWQGAGAPPASDDAIGLIYWTVELPTAGDLAAVEARLQAAGEKAQREADGVFTTDPWGNRLLLAVA